MAVNVVGVTLNAEISRRPFTFFFAVGAILLVGATAILSVGMVLTAMLSMTCGLILSTVTLGRREMKRLFYLQYAKSADLSFEASAADRE